MRFFPSESRSKSTAKRILILYVFLAVGSLFYLFTHLKFNYELENFFPEDNEVIRQYKKHLNQFESEHDLILVSAQAPSHLFDADFLGGISAATQKIESDSTVTAVVSPLRITKFAKAFPVPRPFPFFHPNQPEKFGADSVVLATTQHPIKDFISMEAKAMLLVVKTKPGLNNTASTAVLQRVEQAFKEAGITQIRTAGRIKGQSYIVSKMEKEFVVLSLITIVSLCVFLWFTFRNIWGVILPAVVVALGLLFTLALMLATHGGIDLVSIILPTVLFVVGVSDSVHLLNHFYTEIKYGRSNYDAMKSAFQEVGVATFLTAITSAIGFFTLITVTVKPIAFFGIFAAIGIVLVYFITFSFLAAAIYLLPVRLHAKTAEIVPQSFLSRLFEGVLRWRWSLLAILALMVYPMIKGIQAIEVNNFFTEELRPNDPHKKDFDFFGRYFHGVRPFELTVEVTDSQQSLLDSSHLLAMRKLETYLVDSYGVGSLVSPLQPLRLVNQMNQGGAEAAFSLPKNSELEKAVVDSVRMLSEEMNRFILSSNERVGRFSGRVGDLGSAIFLEKNKVFMDFLNREIEPLGVKASLTGISEIIDSNNEYLTDNLMEGLIYELLAIALLMGLLFRNWRITLVSIIPNVFPLLFIGACMGWFGVHLNLSSAIIFNIAFGITVDDTIHLLAGYKLELAKGKRGREALRAAYLHSGKAVFMTSIILCSGFFVLMMSQFNGIYHTGLLVGITLIVALISDLVLLPILLGGKSE
jgi:uncharacterized protein